MKLYVDIPFRNVTYSFGLLNNCSSSRIKLNDFCVIDVFKIHNHCYSFKAFFFYSERIVSTLYYKSKTELHSAIQSLLKEELLHVEQF